MRCCAECFGDRGLRRSIIPLHSSEIGRCSYCRTSDTALVAPTDLAIYFESLVDAYRRDPKGKPLIRWLRDDWDLFRHPRMDDSRAKSLLGEILSDDEIVRHRFSPVSVPSAVSLSDWEKLRDELMYKNRYFPKKTIDLERLEELLPHLALDVDEVPANWYRARVQPGDSPFLAREMNAPPKRIASHGRANPAGIPYLYLGSSPVTAISEIRPHTGEIACIAAFTTRRRLRIIDLRSPRKVVSPFILDTGGIGRLRNDLPFLERLGDELTRPVLPQAAAIDYTPSQYLCEFIKNCGYQGVIYRSSVSDGMNLALFDPKLARCGAVTQHRVTRVAVEIAGGL